MLRGLGQQLVRLILFFSVVFISAIPYQVLVLASPAGERLYELPIGAGDGFVLRFIHSVERTPVESEYRVLSGRIWQFEERIVSHNAGLPTEALPNARFLMTREWMIIRGGGFTASEIRYRTGDENLGRNEFFPPGGERIALYEIHPRQVLVFSADMTTTLARLFSRPLFH